MHSVAFSSRRSFSKWLLPACGEWLVILAIYFIGCIANKWYLWPLCVVLIGSRQHALGVLGHDSAHFAATQSRLLNDLSANLLCFWPLLTTVKDFRSFHLRHHKFFDTPQDPELIFKSWTPQKWKLPISRKRLIGYFLTDVIGLGIPEIMGAYKLLRQQHPDSWIGRAVFWSSASLFLVEWNMGRFLLVWFLAIPSSFWAFFRLRTWTEHVGTDSTHRVHANWWQRLLITPHGSWSHCEHHSYPAVPFWRRAAIRASHSDTITMRSLLDRFAEKQNLGVQDVNSPAQHTQNHLEGM